MKVNESCVFIVKTESRLHMHSTVLLIVCMFYSFDNDVMWIGIYSQFHALARAASLRSIVFHILQMCGIWLQSPAYTSTLSWNICYHVILDNTMMNLKRFKFSVTAYVFLTLIYIFIYVTFLYRFSKLNRLLHSSDFIIYKHLCSSLLIRQ